MTDGGCPPPYLSGTTSITYQINAAHTGAQPTDELRLPLCQRWSRNLGGAPGYPVVAGGRVFVATRTNLTGYGTLLWALDQKTGAILWGPVDLAGTYWWTGLAYEDGRVFAVNANGYLRAVDAATGAVLWGLQVPGQYSCDSPPTAVAGTVYTGAAGSGGTVYAINTVDGGIRWTKPVANGSTSSPAVTPAGVYVSYACNQAYGFSPANGSQLWHYAGQCSGGGGKTVAVHQGKVFTRDLYGNLMLDTGTGLETGRYNTRFIPAFSGDTMFTTFNSQLRAQPVADAGTSLWSFATTSISTAPIVIGPHVVVASTSRLYVLNISDGTVASSTPLTGVLGPDEQNLSTPLAGFAAADGMLFVPAGYAIVAY